MRRMLKALWRDEEGQGITEYALLLVLVSLGLILVLENFRDELGNVFETATEELEDATPIDQAGGGGGGGGGPFGGFFD